MVFIYHLVAAGVKLVGVPAGVVVIAHPVAGHEVEADASRHELFVHFAHCAEGLLEFVVASPVVVADKMHRHWHIKPVGVYAALLGDLVAVLLIPIKPRGFAGVAAEPVRGRLLAEKRIGNQ